MRLSTAMTNHEFDDSRLNSYGMKLSNGRIVLESYMCFANVYDKTEGCLVREFRLSLCNLHQHSLGFKIIFNKRLKFILNESIFKDAFITKTVRTAYRTGISVDVTKNRSFIYAALSCIRSAWEFPEQYLYPWYSLVTNGVDPNLALCFGSSFSKDTFSFRISGTFGLSGHSWIGYRNLDQLTLFLERGFKKEKEVPFFESPQVRGVHDLSQYTSDKKDKAFTFRELFCNGQDLNPWRAAIIDLPNLLSKIQTWENTNGLNKNYFWKQPVPPHV